MASLKPKQVEGRNIENMIGVTEVPLGLAGPLKIKTRNYSLPLATTEGALVASINRGCKATRLAGTVTVKVEEVGATRGPVFKVKDLAQAEKLVAWLDQHFNHLKRLASAKEKHLKLVAFQPQVVGRSVYVRFVFDTQEAMGMNMVTMATDAISREIKKKLGIDCVALSGNFCVDKKGSWLNFVGGRGKKVWAEVVLPRKVVRLVLKTTPEKIVEVVYRKQLLGSVVSGSMGANGHYANIVAALFLATGQDMAHVVEGSLGITTAEITPRKVARSDPSEVESALYFSVYLPDVMVGTVGGGTHLPSQQKALKMLGWGNKKGDAVRLAEVVGGAVLAGELSLTAALASGDLARAHQRLGRGKK